MKNRSIVPDLERLSSRLGVACYAACFVFLLIMLPFPDGRTQAVPGICILFVHALLSGWYKAIQLKALVETLREQESAAAKRLQREQEARQWADKIDDFEAARESLDEERLAETNREAQAWDEFRRVWQPSPREKRLMARRMGAPAPVDLARDAFNRHFESKFPLIVAKERALHTAEEARERYCASAASAM